LGCDKLPHPKFTNMNRRLLVYFEFARVAFLKILAYRLRYFTGIVTYFVNVSVYYFIWSAIYGSSSNVAGYDLRQMTTYVAIGWIVRSFYFNNVDRDMAAEVQEGKIAINLIKPIDPQLMYISQTAGEASFRAVLFTLPIAVVLVLVYPIARPPSIHSGILFVCSCVLALLIFTLINFTVGTLALHIYSILGVIRAKYAIVEFFSGLLIPISFFPAGLQKAMAFLPFQHISFTPLQIYLGKAQGLAAWEALGEQFLWVLFLYAASRIFWQYSTRRLSIQGG
jgi:ABC-2 type transport system permease protein